MNRRGFLRSIAAAALGAAARVYSPSVLAAPRLLSEPAVSFADLARAVRRCRITGPAHVMVRCPVEVEPAGSPLP